MGSLEYFDKVKHDGNKAENLQRKYNEATKGLDQDVAFEALDGGRVFGDSDRKRYDELMAKRSSAKEKAQAQPKTETQNIYESEDTAAEANKLKDQYINTIRPGTTSKMDAAMKNNQQQNINQDNDQTSSITGDNNTVYQQQDNSIRQYGGDNRSFSYKGGNSGVDTPVSNATMAGFYDVDDSPAAQAKFLDLHSTLNNDAQKKYSGMGMRTASMFKNYDARGYDPAKLEDNLKKDEQRSYDRSTLAKLDAFGDRDAYRGTLGEFKFGAEPKAVNYGDDEDDDD